MRVNGIIHGPTVECTGIGLVRRSKALHWGIGVECDSLGGGLLGSLFYMRRRNFVSYAAEFGKKS
jgi:hypothetical protein